ncbi:ORF6C domain-containing protein [Bacillus stratosphericus]|uniref:ORF6C domain-containing protein n=1 Tax=Bacillus altitudinis TaxID=293387 RepID=UPI002B2ACA5C|nr:ORF6C domain-containing protein [Bacillus stratosphericus]
MSCVTAKQLKVIRGTMQTFCSHLEYDGHGKLHINTIIAFIKKEFGVRKMKDIPQSRFHEALELIQDFDLYTDKIQIRDRLSERNSLN